MLVNMIPSQHFSEFSVSLAKSTALSNVRLFRPLPSSLSVSLCLSLLLSLLLIRRLMGTSERMSKKHLRQVCETHNVISVERVVSLRP